MSKNETTVNKYTDTHLRVVNDLRQSLDDIRMFYNSRKHEDTPAISINSLCNLAIMCLKDQLHNLSDDEAMTYITTKASEYDSLRAKTEYMNEFNKEEEL